MNREIAMIKTGPPVHYGDPNMTEESTRPKGLLETNYK
jgi:hypothetical protein